MTPPPTSVVDILRWRARNQPHRLAYRFLVGGDNDELILTYADLDHRARSIAASLQSSGSAGDRALLLFPPGIDFIAGYFGCLYAGIIAVPAYPPHPARPERTLPIIRSIAADAAPAFALLTSSLFEEINSNDAAKVALRNLKLLVTDRPESDERIGQWQPREFNGNDIAFLQYTSGSTTASRGVMVSHGNLMHNLAHIENFFGQSSESHAVIWLPPYHDMGLVGGILQPLYSGYPATLIPQMMFLQHPYRWLQAISRFRATTSGAPNFAYDLCIRKVRPEQRERIDLSCWEVAFNGAEQVYHKTLDRFADYFAPCGFRRTAFLPCYGLAEATLMVTGGPKDRPPVVRHLISSALEQNKVIVSPTSTGDDRALVGCGQNLSDQKIRIVDPETLMLCPADQVGEIWVNGPSVASGYWSKPSESEFTFGARVSGTGEGPFLRTGDLGFLLEGELYVTGRLKELIISDGNNHYPNDIERTVERSHSAIRQAGCAAFSISNSSGERLIVIAEIEYKADVKAEEVIKAIRKSVSVHHELAVADIRLARAGGIPRTPSGKIKRYLCKANYLNGALKEIALA